MKDYEISDILYKYAPLKLSDELVALENGMDNSGMILKTGKEINKILFALDLTNGVVDSALQSGAEMIVTHHPAIYYPIKRLSVSGDNSSLTRCAMSGISVCSLHLNLDAAEEGTDYYFAKATGGEISEIIDKLGENTGYGRKVKVNTTFDKLYERMKKELSATRSRKYGIDGEIESAACFCGGGLDDSAADKIDADVYISADIRHHVILKLLERNKRVIEFTHYESEIYGFKKFYEKIKSDLKNVSCDFYVDKRLI